MSVSLARRILTQGVVPAEVLHRALFESLRRATPLLQTLVEARADLGDAIDRLLGGGHSVAPEGWIPDRGLMTRLPPGMCERLLAFPIRAGLDGEIEIVAADAADPHVTREFVAHLGTTVIVLSAPLAQVLAAAGVRSAARSGEHAAVRVAAVPSQSERPIPLVRKSSGQSRDRVATRPGTSEAIEPPPSSRSIASVPVRSAVPPSPRSAPTRVSTAAAPDVNEPPANRVPTERGMRPTPTPSQERRIEPLAPEPAVALDAVQPPNVGKATVPEVPKPAHFGKVTMPDAPRAFAKPTGPEAGKAAPVAAKPPVSQTPKPIAAKPLVSQTPKPVAVAKAPVAKTPQPAVAADASRTEAPRPAVVAKATVAEAPQPAVAAKPVVSHTPQPTVIAAPAHEAPRPVAAKPTTAATPKPRPVIGSKAPGVPKPAGEEGSLADALKGTVLSASKPTASAESADEPLRVGLPPVMEPIAEPVPAAVAPQPPVSHSPEPQVAAPQAAAPQAVAPQAAAPQAGAPQAATAVERAARVTAREFVPKAPLAGAPAVAGPVRRVAPPLRVEEVEDRLSKAENPDEIARCLALGGGAGAVVFGVRPEQFVVRALGNDEARPDLTLPRDAASVMRVAAEQDEFFGPLFDAPAHEPLFGWIDAGKVVFAAAVKVRERAALVLLLPASANEDDTRHLGRRLSRAGARALEELIVRRKRTSHP